MSQILFKTENDISTDWLFYIENESNSLAQRDEFEIQNYLDREIFNPEMKDYLSTKNLEQFLSDVKESESLNLNLMEGLKANILPEWMRPRFRKLKTKIKIIICDIVRKIGDLTTEDIIKGVLVALIPAFGAGFPAVILPIVIGLIAFLLKYGIEKACPA